jgi:hypothetical protein
VKDTFCRPSSFGLDDDEEEAWGVAGAMREESSGRIKIKKVLRRQNFVTNKLTLSLQLVDLSPARPALSVLEAAAHRHQQAAGEQLLADVAGLEAIPGKLNGSRKQR